jgi:hypothetical protein
VNLEDGLVALNARLGKKKEKEKERNEVRSKQRPIKLLTMAT